MSASEAVNIPRIGLGSWSYGGDNWSHGWGPQPEKQTIQTILDALNSGVQIIDTAPVYGLGVAEEIIGHALKLWKGNRPFIMTKCGQGWCSNRRIKLDLDPHAIRTSCHNSLRRLNVDKIDLMFLHYPSSLDYENLNALAELVKLKNEGKIVQIGLSNFNKEQIMLACNLFKIDALQNHYSILNRQVEKEILPYCIEKKIKFFAYQPLESGLLTGKFFTHTNSSFGLSDWRSRSPSFDQNNLNRIMGLNCQLLQLSIKYNVPLPAISLRWVLENQAVSVALVGIRNTKQLSEDLLALEFKLFEKDIQMLEDSLVGSDYPRY